jgi:cysteinyl-tRNA synthetase
MQLLLSLCGTVQNLIMKLFDTLRMKRIRLGPYPEQIKILVCGPTLYELCHLGHARVLYFYDLMTRYFIYKGFHTMTVVTITDIDPKISAKAIGIGNSTQAVSDKFMIELLHDMSLLQIGGSFLLARVSDYVNVAIVLIKKLSSEKLAYSASGNIYIDVRKVLRYGEMSGMPYDKIKELRIDIAANKRNPGDILLWNSINLSCQQFYDPAFGNGIPWWHIQDASIAMSIFEGRYDIHGGGIELIYPHHETILGQLRALTNLARPVNWWSHVGTVTIRGNKMSNSLSNTLKIRDLAREFLPNVIKLYLLSKHYREDLAFSRTHLKKYVSINKLIAESIISENDSDCISYSNKIFWKFQTCLDNDFDTQGALNILLEGITNGIDGTILSKMTDIFGLYY